MLKIILTFHRGWVCLEKLNMSHPSKQLIFKVSFNAKNNWSLSLSNVRSSLSPVTFSFEECSGDLSV